VFHKCAISFPCCFPSTSIVFIKHYIILVFYVLQIDIKIYTRVRTIEDCLKLQDDLNKFSLCCCKLGLSFNLSKCKVMSFSRARSPIIFSYQLNESGILRVYNTIIDSGFKFNTSLDPGDHIDYICYKALKTLGFIMRLQARDFHLGLSISHSSVL